MDLDFMFSLLITLILCLVPKPCQMTGFDIGCEDVKHDLAIIIAELQRKEVCTYYKLEK